MHWVQGCRPTGGGLPGRVEQSGGLFDQIQSEATLISGLPGLGPAFLEKPGEKHQGETPWTPIFIMAPARTGYFCFRFRLFPLLSRYTGKVSDAITEGC